MEIASDKKSVYKFLDNMSCAEILDLKAFYVKEAPFVINEDMRAVLYQHPNSVVIYRNVPVYINARLQFGIGMRPTAWDKGGGSVIFEIEVMNRRGEVKRLYQREIDPKKNLDHRRWFDEEIDLKEFNGQNVTFFFKTRSPSPEDRASSWVGWSWPRVISEGKILRVKKGEEQPNILLITIDTLRADHLSCYGKNTLRTPISDMLAEEGVRFNQVYSQSHITSPSHLALLTSKYPIRHVRDNNPCIVSPELKNMAHLLSRKGYTTFGIVSVELFNPYWCVNIDRDFKYYYPVWGNNRIGAQGRDIFHDWLKDHYSKRFFGWIHLFDPHAPYIPPRSHYKMYYQGDEKSLSGTSMRQAEFPVFFKDNVAWLDGVTDIAFPVAQYAAEVSYVDSVVGDILQDLDNYGLLEKTLVILTSDHGESLTEHDIFFDHQSLYDPILHIPLIMRYPTKLPRGKVIESLAMSIDVLPTVFDLLGYEIPGDIDGKSLLPLIRGEAGDIHDAVFSEHVDGTQLMVRTRKWKYIKSLKDWHYTGRFSIKKGQIELYDLENDPEESKNIAYFYPETARELDLRLSQWLREHSEGSLAERLPGDEEIKERLKSLGYF
jgi:arylsulfatase A-like enzyme